MTSPESAKRNAISNNTEASTTLLQPAFAKEYFRFCNNGLDVASADDFISWLESDLSKLLPYEAFSCGLGDISPTGITIRALMGINFPIEYLDKIKNSNGFLNSPIILKWMQERQPQLFDMSLAKAYPEQWVENFKTHNLRNIASHGLVDIGGRALSYFGLHRLPGKVGERHASMLKLLVPHMHHALVKITRTPRETLQGKTNSSYSLTKREQDILRWICMGKSNVEIGEIVGISPFTAKRHVANVLSKLAVRNRSQAVAKAVQEQIIEC